MNTKNFIKGGLISLLIIAGIVFAVSLISFSNKEIDLNNSFNQKMDERVAFYDKMYKIINQKSQIAVKNDSSFRQNVNIIMEGRKDSEQVFFKWITETNPNAEYREVSALYKDLSRSIEAQREGFFIQEKVLQDINRQHSNLLQKFPGSLYNGILNRKPLNYKPIQSSITEEIFRTGKEDNIKLDL